MKFSLFFVGLCSILVVHCGLLDTIFGVLNIPLDVVDILFGNFLTKYKKNYSRTEKLKRRLLYSKVINLIDNYNEQFDQGLISWEMAENEYSDWTDAERRRLSNGNRISSFDYALMARSGSTFNDTVFPPGPTSVDFSYCTTPVKDQGYSCNSCWSFAAIAALECQWCLKTGQLRSMSEQQLIDCNRNDYTGSWGCDGGSMASAYLYAQGSGGVQSDDTYSYDNFDNTRVFPCRSNSSENVAYPTGYWRLRPNETALKDFVASAGCVAAAMSGNLDTFYFYSRGVYDDVNCVPGTQHAVLIVGYGTQNGKVSRSFDGLDMKSRNRASF